MKFLRTEAFWGTIGVLGTIAVIGAIAWSRPHSFGIGFTTAVVVMVVWWGISAQKEQVHRHIQERKIEELTEQVNRLTAAASPRQEL